MNLSHEATIEAYVSAPLAQEDQARADFYALIAHLLLSPPSEEFLAELSRADSLAAQQADHPLDLAWEKLVAAAGLFDRDAVREEFASLFQGIGTPRLNPYASLYLSGFMMEKPLAALRDDLARLGLGRTPGAHELEDHLGALCETMRLLIAGGAGAKPQNLGTQKTFFEKHLAPWYERCLDDIQLADEANFYRYVAGFAGAFLAVESEAFAMEGPWDANLANLAN